MGAPCTALLSLCDAVRGFQEGGRQALWSVNGPRILQVGYEDEEDPASMEAFERVGALVRRKHSTESVCGAPPNARKSILMHLQVSRAQAENKESCP